VSAPTDAGLVLAVAAAGAARPGGRLPMAVTLSNRGAAPATVNRRLALGYRDVPVRELFAVVADADSGLPAAHEVVDYDRPPSPPADYVRLDPGASVSAEVDLFEFYAPRAPGRYRVTLFYQADGPLAEPPPEIAGGTYAAPPFDIEVAP
jgi:hypothetical protein